MCVCDYIYIYINSCMYELRRCGRFSPPDGAGREKERPLPHRRHLHQKEYHESKRTDKIITTGMNGPLKNSHS